MSDKPLTPSDQAALLQALQAFDENAHGLRQRRTVLDLAMLFFQAHQSLWYQQARQWCTQVPIGLEEAEVFRFQYAAALLVRIVDAGYDAATHQWWSVARHSATTKAWARHLLGLRELGRTIERLRHAGGTVISSEFPLVFDLLLWKGWQHEPSRVAEALLPLANAAEPAPLAQPRSPDAPELAQLRRQVDAADRMYEHFRWLDSVGAMTREETPLLDAYARARTGDAD